MTRADLAAVEEANAEFYAAFEAGDLDRMSAVWAGGPHAASVGCVHPGWPLLKGRDEVLRSWALIMANTPYIQFVLTDLHTEVFGDHALVTCSENIITMDDSGEDAGMLAGGSIVATNLFLRVEGEWRLLHHHGSPVLNQMEDDEE
ncbi:MULTISPECIES: nuclear transport factor 2 family protein [Thermomonospora]|uniref:Ketosteroid isomerase-like protein n=1 Tax=Thermomonospora cellulosilytica TaxID=1411118 RepID=A0A7W3MTA3_9ACTN|nr:MULTISPECIES: nuclear transport factor 2 family protein [Thermomonospora]MBA9001506.1 ketosteroid isomerase-like protein [Thermomonospora cellulosilytica]